MDELPVELQKIILAYKQDLDDMIALAWKRYHLNREFHLYFFPDFNIHSDFFDIYLSDSENDEIGAN